MTRMAALKKKKTQRAKENRIAHKKHCAEAQSKI